MPASAADLRPPAQAGIVPSALAAFSPPRGVRSCPRRAASCGLTAPHADCANSTAAAKRTTVFIAAPSERKLDARGEEVAIVQQVVLASAVVVGIREVELPPLAHARGDSNRARQAAGEKRASRTRRYAVHVLAEGGVRQQVPVADHVVVLETAGDDQAPGEGRGKRADRLHALLGGHDAPAVHRRELRVTAEIRIAAQVGTRCVVEQAEALRAARDLAFE